MVANHTAWSELIALPTDGGRRTAHELVRDALRDAILRGSLPGGTRLVQADIAATLDVSTTPVREALRDLATEGLIRLDAHRGAMVTTLTHDDVQEIYDLRRLLEPEAIRRAATNITLPELETAQELGHRMEVVGDAAKWNELNGTFHGILLTASRSPRLVAILERLRANASPYVAVALSALDADFRAANHEHKQMLDALRQGDADRAAEIVENHLGLTVRLLTGSQAPIS